MRSALRKGKEMAKRQHASRRPWGIAPTLALIFLSACGTKPGTCDVLPLREYPQAFRDGLASELAGFPDGAPIVQFVGDSLELRAAVRGCKGK